MLIQSWLRRCGVVVHHAARMPTAADGEESVVLFLEAALDQHDLARRCALRLPGISTAHFSGHSRGVMYLAGRDPGPYLCSWA
jgi:hypothetical protein